MMRDASAYPVRIESISPASKTEWDRAWKGSESATYFQSRGWAEVWKQYRPLKLVPKPYTVEFSDGVTAVLPLMQRRHSLRLEPLASYISSQAGTYGGWLSEQQLYNEHVVLLIETLITRFSPLNWRVNPFDEQAKASVVAQSNREMDYRPSRVRKFRVSTAQSFTRALDLTCGFDTIFSRWTKGHRSAVSKAQRKDVRIRVSNDLGEWREYFGIYEKALERWGEDAGAVYEWELFALLFEQSDNAKLWVADYDGRIVAGALLLYAPTHVSYWHGAFLPKYSKVRPVNLLMYEAIRDSCEKGLKWYDFNPSGGHEGVDSFKKSFGAFKVSSPVVSTTKDWRILLRRSRAVVREILPKWLKQTVVL